MPGFLTKAGGIKLLIETRHNRGVYEQFCFMNIKCKLGFHDWDIWQESILNKYVSHKEKQQQKMCMLCYKRELRPHPPLEERILDVLNTKDLIIIHDLFFQLKRNYGTLAFNKAIVKIAQNHFYIAIRWSRDEISQRLVRYYVSQTLTNGKRGI